MIYSSALRYDISIGHSIAILVVERVGMKIHSPSPVPVLPTVDAEHVRLKGSAAQLRLDRLDKLCSLYPHGVGTALLQQRQSIRPRKKRSQYRYSKYDGETDWWIKFEWFHVWKRVCKQCVELRLKIEVVELTSRNARLRVAFRELCKRTMTMKPLCSKLHHRRKENLKDHKTQQRDESPEEHIRRSCDSSYATRTHKEEDSRSKVVAWMRKRNEKRRVLDRWRIGSKDEKESTLRSRVDLEEASWNPRIVFTRCLTQEQDLLRDERRNNSLDIAIRRHEDCSVKPSRSPMSQTNTKLKDYYNASRCISRLAVENHQSLHQSLEHRVHNLPSNTHGQQANIELTYGHRLATFEIQNIPIAFSRNRVVQSEQLSMKQEVSRSLYERGFKLLQEITQGFELKLFWSKWMRHIRRLAQLSAALEKIKRIAKFNKLQQLRSKFLCQKTLSSWNSATKALIHNRRLVLRKAISMWKTLMATRTIQLRLAEGYFSYQLQRKYVRRWQTLPVVAQVRLKLHSSRVTALLILR